MELVDQPNPYEWTPYRVALGVDYQKRIEQAIERGIGYLEQHQYPNGEFCCYMATDDAMQEWCIPDSAIFPTALIGGALLPLANLPPVNGMLARAAQFLESQRLPGHVWNHYTSWHRWHDFTPADVDDTACVSIFLRSFRGASLANVPLLLANRNAQGLFYTWFVLRPRWITNRVYWRVTLREALNPVRSLLFWLNFEPRRNDIDGVVNANVLYYLGDTADTQPIIKYLLRIIDEKQEAVCDKWYLNPFSVYYFLSRNYYNGIAKLELARQPMIDRILSTAQPDGRLGESALDTALGICTLLNWRVNPPALERAIDFLVRGQQPTGAWSRQRLYYGGPKRQVGFGSEELTTGFCLEALSRYIKPNQK